MYVETAGNQLERIEFAANADRFATNASPAPMPVSRRITEAFLTRCAILPERTRSTLVLAAAADRGELDVIARAGVALGLTPADLAAEVG